ncbi:MAG: hypothetical protein LBR10_15020 [Prevotellaceae bacterium]|jgi:hypothetical protein|nr:hypothetical protein [Prevotellaceae bacterium]
MKNKLTFKIYLKMKKIITFTLCVFITTGCFSQKHIEQKEFEKLVDYVNVEITKAYIEATIKLTSTNKKDSIAFIKKIQSQLAKNEIDHPIKGSALIKLLNNNSWSVTCTNLTEKYDSIKSKYKSDKSNQDLIDLLFDFSFTIKETTYKITEHLATKELCKNLKDEITEKYSATTRGQSTEINAEVTYDNITNESLKQLEKNINILSARVEKIESKSLNPKADKLVYILFIVDILFIVIVLILIAYILRIKHKLSKSPVQSNGNSTTSPKDTNEIEKRIKALEYFIYDQFAKEYNTLVSSHNDLVTKMENLTSKSTETRRDSVTEQSRSNQNTTKQPESKVFYMSTPNFDGSFWDRNSRQELDPTAACYKFVEENSGVAKFYTVEHDQFYQRALQNPYNILDPVCEATNAMANNRKIKTIEPGTARKSGDKWIVNPTAKAKIKYE